MNNEEPVITMTEFKTVVEDFKTEQKRLSEYMLHLNQKMDIGFKEVREDIRTIKDQVGALTVDVHGLKSQVSLLHEGQTEIKNALTQKVERDEFARLEMRVTKLENRAA